MRVVMVEGRWATMENESEVTNEGWQGKLVSIRSTWKAWHRLLRRAEACKKGDVIPLSR